MKQFNLLTLVLLLLLSSSYSSGQPAIKAVPQTVSSSKVNVYYFHFTPRCSTCMAVEKNARNAVEELYPNEAKSGLCSFISLNLDENDVKEIADKLGVGGQTLLIVCGDKKLDITSSGFLNAHNPDKMKQEIKSAVDKVLL